MQKKLCLALCMTLISYWVESKSIGASILDYDKLDTNIDDLKYEIEEEDIDDFSKLLDEAGKKTNNADSAKNDKTSAKTSAKNSAKSSATSVDTSGSKKKSTEDKGVNIKTNIEDLKKFFSALGGHKDGTYDDNDVFALFNGAAGKAVGVTGNEDRKYRKGTKIRGFHNVHHKDEYKKDNEFFEDDETSGVIKKVGAKGSGFKVASGLGFNKGHFHHDHTKGLYGKEGFSDKENIDKEINAYTDSQGFDSYFNTNK